MNGDGNFWEGIFGDSSNVEFVVDGLRGTTTGWNFGTKRTMFGVTVTNRNDVVHSSGSKPSHCNPPINMDGRDQRYLTLNK